MTDRLKPIYHGLRMDARHITNPPLVWEVFLFYMLWVERGANAFGGAMGGEPVTATVS